MGGTFLHWRNQKFRVFSNSKMFKTCLENQWKFYNFEKIFKFTYKNLNGKLMFYSFSLPSSRTFVILYTPGTYQNFRGWFGGGCSAGLGVLWILGGWRAVLTNDMIFSNIKHWAKRRRRFEDWIFSKCNDSRVFWPLCDMELSDIKNIPLYLFRDITIIRVQETFNNKN